MNRSHVQVLILASVALAGGVIAWLCVLPDGTGHTFRREEHVFVSLGSCLVGGLGLYLAVVVPVILHALRSRWPFRLFLVVAVLFALLNVGPILHGLDSAEEKAQNMDQVLDYLWGLLLSVGLLILYLVTSVCFVAWAVWQRNRAEQKAVPEIRSA
jgi:hypothetical protein